MSSAVCREKPEILLAGGMPLVVLESPLLAIPHAEERRCLFLGLRG